MAETPQDMNTEVPSTVDHNVRVVTLTTGEHVICNFGQVREDQDGESKFVAYQLLYPLVLTLSESTNEEDGTQTFNVTYRRLNPYTPYEDHRVNPTSVLSAMPPAIDILRNYVYRLRDANVDLSFLPNEGKDILGETDGATPDPASAATEGPVATGEGGGD